VRRPSDARETRLFTYAPPHALLDELNTRILGELRRDPRLTMTALGRRIGMSAPAVTERVRRLEEVGVIRGYRLDLDPAALGLPLTAYIRIRPDPGQLPKVAELARSIPEVVECHRITGEDCFFLKLHLRSIDDLEGILDRFTPYGRTTTSLIHSSPVTNRPLPLAREGEAS